MYPVFLLTLSGCWSNYWWKGYDEMNTLDPTEVPYQVDGLTATDAVVTGFTSTLTCPDGEAASFFAVYREGLSNAPVALVFHSGAFDYVLDPDADQPLAGDHYYVDSRLDRTWSVNKIWETLGMIYPRTVDAGELNLGTLPAALTDAGVVQIYPGNCWGDLWHNATNVAQNESVDGFSREGRSMALDMVDMLFSADAASDLGFTLPVTLNNNEIYLVGIGEGGRAVNELLLSDELPQLAGALIDSSPDDLSAYVDASDAYVEEVEGLARIFGDDGLDDLSAWSILNTPTSDMPDNLGFIWSSQDTRLPLGAGQATAAALEASGAWVYDTGRAEHVALNGDIELATQAVDFMLTGQVP